MRNRKLIRDNVDTEVRILFKYHKLNYDGYANHLHGWRGGDYNPGPKIDRALY